MERKNWKRAAWIAAAAVLALALGAGAWAWLTAFDKYDADQSVRIYVPAGATDYDIALRLGARLKADKGFGEKVYRLWRLQRGSAARAHGSYEIKPGMTALQVSRMLKGGHQTPVKVTFNNARTMDDLAERVCRWLEITPDQFLQACDSLLGLRGVKTEQYPAMFVPDTHEFYWTATPCSVVERLIKARDKFWTPERVEAASSLGLSPEEAATLASIVEEETAKGDERPKVAGLYLNRLEKGMLLQADPTVKFAVHDFSLKRILASHLKEESPYNTYIHPGLPPGPIRVASKAGIDAVLHPARHAYLYMCAKEDFSGYHNFASTFAEHQQNAARYRKVLNARGIK
ncbi:MAG: endolytic transglycosylase MltG [Clostridium sp.]|nr:endolytic transglycosylase MltG [Clostridium sp.]